MESAGLSGGTWSNKNYMSETSVHPHPPPSTRRRINIGASGDAEKEGLRGPMPFFLLLLSSTLIQYIHAHARGGKID